MQVSRAFYDDMHTQKGDPWNYTRRAAEILRHDTLLSVVSHHTSGRNGSAPYILDVGCSTGVFTRKLSAISSRSFGMDISESALNHPSNIPSSSVHPAFIVGSSSVIPFKSSTFDALILADGISEWQLSDSDRTSMLAETHRVLRTGGVALFTDYMRPSDFHKLVAIIQNSPLTISSVQYLNDRLWYQFEGLFKAVRNWPVISNALASVSLAKSLRSVSSLLGKIGSRHILVVAEKKS